MASTSSAASLNSLIRLHNRERLFVQPLQWTSRHLELLQCSFDDQPLTPLQSVKPRRRRVPSRAIRVRLLSDLSWYNRVDTLEAILGCVRDSNLSGLSFSFAQRPTKRGLPCALFSLRDPRQEDTCDYLDAAFIDYYLLSEARHNSVYAGPQQNIPCYKLSLRKLRRLYPKQRLHDPYIVAVLIALAQRRRRSQYNGSAPLGSDKTTVFKPLVFLGDDTTDSIYIFTAEITSSFLNRFDFPALPFSAPQPTLIQHFVVPFEPYRTFRRRLRACLFPAPPREKQRQEPGVQNNNNYNDNGTNHDHTVAESNPVAPDCHALDEEETDKIVEGVGQATQAEPGEARREHLLEPQEKPLEVSTDLETQTKLPNWSPGSPSSKLGLKRMDPSDADEQGEQQAAKRARPTEEEEEEEDGNHDHQPCRNADGIVDMARMQPDISCPELMPQLVLNIAL